MTRRTSVYLTDDLSEAVAEDGRSLPDLIRAGLELPSPLRLTKTERQVLARVAVALGHGSNGSQEARDQAGSGSQMRRGRRSSYE